MSMQTTIVSYSFGNIFVSVEFSGDYKTAYKGEVISGHPQF